MSNVYFKEIKNDDKKFKNIYDIVYGWDKKHYCFDMYDCYPNPFMDLDEHILMYINDELAGYGSIFSFVFRGTSEEKEAYLSCIISPKYRKKGYGRILLEHLITQSREKHNVDIIKVDIFKKNIDSVSLVEKFEFDFEKFDDEEITFSKRLNIEKR